MRSVIQYALDQCSIGRKSTLAEVLERGKLTNISLFWFSLDLELAMVLLWDIFTHNLRMSFFLERRDVS